MQISEAKSTEELSDLLACDSYSFVREVDYSKPQPQYGDKKDLVHSIALHYVIFSVEAELDQIVQGLYMKVACFGSAMKPESRAH